jgi:hypothetical protein
MSASCSCEQSGRGGGRHTLEVLRDGVVRLDVLLERVGGVERRVERLAVGKGLEDLLGLAKRLVERLLLQNR